MVTACTTVAAGRLQEARRLVASLTEHDPGAALSVLVLERRETVQPRDEDFLVVTPSDLDRGDDTDVLAAAYGAEGLAEALLPAMLRALLAQSDHVVVLEGASRITGSVAAVADAARAAGVLVDADGRLIGLGRGPAAQALLDDWDAVIRGRHGTAAPLPRTAAVLDGPRPWDRAEAHPDAAATGWERTWNDFPMDAPLRRAFRDGWRAGRLTRAPYDPIGEEAFFAYLAEPAERGGGAGVTRYMQAVHDADPAVAERVGELDDDGATALVAWLRGPGGRDRQPPPFALTGPPGRHDAVAGRAAEPPPFGANLVGYLSAEQGVGESARQLISALDTQDVPVLPIRIPTGSHRESHPFAAVDGFPNPFAVNLLVVNADQTVRVLDEAGPAFRAGRRTVGLWAWEVPELPSYFAEAFRAVDEVWAFSSFVVELLRRSAPCPVNLIPMPVAPPAGAAPDRGRFGLGDDEVVFLFIYDYNSIFERKNPLGLLEAYRRAFGAAAGTRLVLKCINADGHPDAHARVVAAAAGRDDVTIIDRYLPVGDKNALLASCDVYVSLHRSEGFGITCAEAMGLGKPVVATRWSGSADYLHPAHSFPVDAELVAVGPGNDPYPATSQWADPDLDQAAAHLCALAQDPELRRRVGERGRAFIVREHGPEAVGARMRARLEVAAALTGTAAPAALTPLPALRGARDAVDRGPAPGGGARLSPKRLGRAALLRATAPRARHQQVVDRRILDATERGVAVAAAAAQHAEGEAWRTAAAGLREQRRLAERVRALEEEQAALAARLARVEGVERPA